MTLVGVMRGIAVGVALAALLPVTASRAERAGTIATNDCAPHRGVASPDLAADPALMLCLHARPCGSVASRGFDQAWVPRGERAAVRIAGAREPTFEAFWVPPDTADDV